MKFRKLTDKQLTEVLNAQVEEMDPKLIMDMFNQIMDDLIACNGDGFARRFSREEIMAAILLEMYLKGFKDAMVIFNEAYGDCIERGKLKNGKHLREMIEILLELPDHKYQEFKNEVIKSESEGVKILCEALFEVVEPKREAFKGVVKNAGN